MTSPAAIAQAVYQYPSSAFNEPGLKNPGQERGQRMPEPLLDGLPNKGSNDLMKALKALDEAMEAYGEAEAFYRGSAGDKFASARVQQLLARAGVNEVEDFNYARVPVDAVAEGLSIRSVVAAPGEDADEEDGESERKKVAERAQEILDGLRKRNQLDAEEESLHLGVSKLGDCYLFVWPVTEDGGELEGEEAESADRVDLEVGGRPVTVDIFVNTADTVRVFYDEENPLRKTYAVKTWEWDDLDTETTRRRATLYYPDRVERWVTRPDEDPDRPESWMPYLAAEGDQEWPRENPYGRIPFFHFRTSRTYGLPEHISAYGPQRLINKLISAHAVTIDYQSFPQRYALMNPKLDDYLTNLIDPDNPEDEDDDPEGEGNSQFRADPSAVWKIPGVTGVGQFSAADPQVFMVPLDRYIKSMAELTSTPLHRFVGYTTPPSGDSLRIGDRPFNRRIERRQDNYGAVWQDAYEFALELLGFTDITVTVQWYPIESASGLEDWNIVAAKIASGVPVEQALMEAGYPSDTVKAWLSDETGADLMRRVALLNSIGTAVQTLGAGVGLGVVSAQQVGDIIARILGLTAEQLPDLDGTVELQPPAPAMPPGIPPPPPPGQAAKPGDRALAQPLPPMPPPPPPVPVGQGGVAPRREET